MAGTETSDQLAKFGAGHGLAYTATAQLPEQGATLSKSGKVDGSASGKLADELEGTLAHYSYVYTWTDADHHTHSETRHFTLVVAEIPESIGFVPYLGFSGPSSQFSPSAGSNETEGVDLREDEALDNHSACVYKGTSKTWLPQLFSPALLDWLARSDDDFGFELASGVLCVGRSARVDDAQGLEGIWKDGGHLAVAIRKECMEEVESGDAATDSAHEVGGEDAGWRPPWPRSRCHRHHRRLGPRGVQRRPAPQTLDLPRRHRTWHGALARRQPLPLRADDQRLRPGRRYDEGGDDRDRGRPAPPLRLLRRAPRRRRPLGKVRGGGLLSRLRRRPQPHRRTAAPLRRDPRRSEAPLQARPRLHRHAARRVRRLAGPRRRRQQALGSDRDGRRTEGPVCRRRAGTEAEGITAKLLDEYVKRLEEAITAPAAKS